MASNHLQSETTGRDSIVAAVRRQELPESIVPLLDAYDDAIGNRDPYLWRWLTHLFPKFTLSCVDDDHAGRAQEAKLLSSLFVTVVDDVAEKRGDRATFEEASKVPFDYCQADPDRRGVDDETIRFLQRVWATFSATIEDSPRLGAFRDVLRFDLQQVVQAIEYARVADAHPALVSERDLWRYDVHNMMIFVYADLDLVNAPSFDAGELGALRQLVRRTQRMARICNWLVTWKRELHEGDLVSGIVVRALESGVVSRDRLEAVRASPTPETVDPVIEAIEGSDLEAQFLADWQAEYDAAGTLVGDLDSVDGKAYLEAFERILVYHVESRGLL
ncbi:hypothetical protein ACFO5R_16015 [Halosolutus amylolyticus]|uniref:Uncharacterized protein n=1 Tax=Halosolutus amylolyticus TaxID=2932267 RepID=A0ABD5PS60_9EURY|nr:hypothetical protein [Halosolutus amylolyticus]